MYLNKLENKFAKNLTSNTGKFLLRLIGIVALFLIKFTDLEKLKLFDDLFVKILVGLFIVYLYFIDMVSFVLFVIVFVVLIQEINLKTKSNDILGTNVKNDNCILGKLPPYKNDKFIDTNKKLQNETKENMIKVVSRDNMNAGFKGPLGEIKPLSSSNNSSSNTSSNNSNLANNSNNSKLNGLDDFDKNVYDHPSSRTITENAQNLSMGFTTPNHLKDIQINSVQGSSHCNAIESVEKSWNAQGLLGIRGIDKNDNTNSYVI